MKKVIESISWLPFKLKGKLRRKSELVNINIDNLTFPFKLIKDNSLYSLTSNLQTYKTREPRNVRAYIDFITEDDIVLDVGANIGFFTILSRKAKKIIAIEPIKKCLEVLRYNLFINNISNVKIYNLCLGNGKELRFLEDKALNQSKVITDKNKGYKVKTKTLDYFTKKFQVNMIKIDVEGYEYEIFRKEIPKKINKIMIEFHTNLMGKEKSLKLLESFYKNGFVIERLIEDLPLRLYPFIKYYKSFSYEKKDLGLKEAKECVLKGRGLKYLYLRRKEHEN